MTSEEAVSIVRDGDRVVVPLTEQPMSLTRALAERASEVRDATLSVAVPQFDVGPFLDAGWNVEIENFIGPAGRPYENDGQAPYLPLAFSLTFKSPDERGNEAKPIDVALVTVAPPNKHGQVTFGPQPWYKRGYAQRANRVAAEVNPSLIRTFGDTFMPLHEINALVEVEPPTDSRERLNQAIAALPDERRAVFEEIVSRVNPTRLVPSIPYFETLNLNRLSTQLGIDDPSPGDRSNRRQCKVAHSARELLFRSALALRRPICPVSASSTTRLTSALHTELTVPGVAKLVEAGVINGSRKTIHRNRAVAVSWSGANDEDLQIIDDNPIFELYSPEYLLDPWLIAKNHAQIGMNNALSVDFTGQIASESVLGGRMINGIGGQPETHIGALYSKGGRAITMLYSTALDEPSHA